jgi:hypothetical protein
MNEISRKKKRKKRQSLEAKISKKLLKSVFIPLIILISMSAFFLSGRFTNKNPKSQVNNNDKVQLIVKEKKYVDVYTWLELMEALANKQVTEIYLKKDIEFPQSQAKLEEKGLTKVNKKELFRFDDTLKSGKKQPVLYVTLLKKNIKRELLIRGEGKSINLGRVELNLPRELTLDFRELKVLRSYQY